MARLTAPLLSLRASGTIAKSIVFSSWKGIPYARVHVIPANPQTAAQQEVRGIFSTLSEMWKRMPHSVRLPFILAVAGLALTARNKHIQENLAALIDQTDLDLLVMSVATGQAVQPANVVTSDGADGTVAWTADAPVAPPGYALAAVYGSAVEDGDPSPVLVRISYHGEANAAPWAGSIDVPTDGNYQVGIFAMWSTVTGETHLSSADRTQVAVTGN